LNSTELLSSGEELGQLADSSRVTVQPLMGKIKQLVTDFDSRLSKRKKKLDDSVRLHRLTAAVSFASAAVSEFTTCYWNVQMIA